MATIAELKERVCAQIDAHREELIQVARTIADNPETGYREAKTSRLVAQKFDELGLKYRDGLAITGVKAEPLRGGSPGPTIAVMGELDALKVAGHVKADPETDAAHACGHNCQVAMMLGVGYGILKADVLPELGGNIALFAVPAEETIENEFRIGLMREGKLEFISGKQELIRLGEFRDIDLAMMCHTSSSPEDKALATGGTSTGHLVKFIQYSGRAAHAAGAPHLGVNALNAANIAINAIQHQRETFQEDDRVRVHGILTAGGTAVNSIPSDVRLEWRVRGRTVEVIDKVNKQVDRCFRAGAQAVGARVFIKSIAGDLPLVNNPAMDDLFHRNAVTLVGEDNVAVHPATRNIGGSTDTGDLSQVIPTIHPRCGGAVGMGHGVDYVIEDYEKAVINPAKAMAMTIIDLLAEGGTRAKEVLDKTKLSMTQDEYIELQRRRMREETYEAKEE